MATKQKAAKTTTGQLQSATNRLKLAAQTRPYFVKVAAAAWVGYRKPLSGPGCWVARVGVGNGKEWEKTLWGADDNGIKADGEKVLTFWQAKAGVQKLACKRPDAESRDSNDTALTLDEALILYKQKLTERGARTSNAQRPRRHLPEKLLAKPCSLISEKELKDWRDATLASGSAKASVNRTMSCVCAALTIACRDLTPRWRDALKALPGAVESNNVVLTEAQAAQWVAEAYALDHQLGLLTHTLAETGARPSQAVRLRVRDLVTANPKAPRLSMPKSGKGGNRYPGERKLERYPVSISAELAALLKAAAKGRPSSAPLLLRKDGRTWSNNPADDYGKDVHRIVEKLGLDPKEYTMYAFRHTSITRMLLSGVHTGIVAKAHDTSEAMIRKHYAANILDFSDEMTRKTLPSLGPLAQPAADNVVKMQQR